MIIRTALFSLLAFSVAGGALAGDWRQPGWDYRARIVIETPRLASPLDTAAVTIFTAGRHRRGAADLRMVDDRGEQVPWRLVGTVDEKRLEILFRVKRGQEEFEAYFGNQDAESPTFDWEPAAGGLVLETRRHTTGRQSSNINQIRQAFENSRGVFGRGARPRIDDTENPFGPNSLYLSYYRGYLRTPVSGLYWFATNSSDGSFLLLDGLQVVAWPGRHNKDGAPSRPRDNTWAQRRAINLEKGVHLIEYYHEQFSGNPLARAGWKGPHDHDFAAIPSKAFVDRLSARQVSLERPGGEMSVFFTFEPTRHLRFHGSDRELIHLRFTPHVFPPPAQDLSFRWDFGGGLLSRERFPEQVFEIGPDRVVTLTVSTRAGKSARISLPVNLPVGVPAENFRVHLELSADKVIYKGQETARITAGAGNYSVRPIALEFSGCLLDRTGKEISRPGTRKEIGAHGFGDFSFSAPAETSQIEFSLLYHGRLLERRTIDFLEPADCLPSCYFDGRRLERENGGQLLLRLGENRPGKTAPPSPTGAGEQGPVVLIGTGGAPLPERSVDLPEKLAELFRAPRTPSFHFLEIDEQVIQPSPLPALARLPEALALNPRLVIFYPGPQETDYQVDTALFRQALSFLGRAVRLRGVPIMFIVPPPIFGKPGESLRLAVAVKEVAFTDGIPTADLYSLFPPGSPGKADPRYRVGRAGVFSDRPNARGQEIIARSLFERITEFLATD